MATKVSNKPSANIVINSLRSIGYSFQTAIADIIDNSISAKAKNVWIESPISNDEGLFITILDDGEGMNKEALFNAMKYGSQRDFYDEKDLGRFGFGLKSASLSQCRNLTVVSKFNEEVNAFRRDLDVVLEDNERNCMQLEKEEIDNLPSVSNLYKLENGTLVIWEKFDFIEQRDPNHVLAELSKEVDKADDYLRLIFHRYLNKKINSLNILINGTKLMGYDPFLENHPKTTTRTSSQIPFAGSIIVVQPFTLPHQNDLTAEDFELLGSNRISTGQGFYIYRNERLIVYGSWFKLVRDYNSELYKYGRIKVDLPSSLDKVMEIDIKKERAVLPSSVLNQLREYVKTVTIESKNKTSKRARLTYDEDDTKLWNKRKTRENKDEYYVNLNSIFIKTFLDDFDDKDKQKIINLINMVGSSIPYNDIYNSMCNKNIGSDNENRTLDIYVQMGIEYFYKFKKIMQKTDEEVLDFVCSHEPFNDENIKNILRSKVEYEKRSI